MRLILLHGKSARPVRLRHLSSMSTFSQPVVANTAESVHDD